MKKLLSIAAVAAFSLVLTTPAFAARYTPSSLERDLNGRNWTAGTKVKFSYLRECTEWSTSTYAPANPQRLAHLQAEKDRLLAINVGIVKKRDVALEAVSNGTATSWATYDHWNSQASPTYEAFLKAEDKWEKEKRNTVVTSTTPYAYECQGGFVRISSPQGVKVCEVTSARVDYEDRRASYNSSNCVWRG